MKFDMSRLERLRIDAEGSRLKLLLLSDTVRKLHRQVAAEKARNLELKGADQKSEYFMTMVKDSEKKLQRLEADLRIAASDEAAAQEEWNDLGRLFDRCKDFATGQGLQLPSSMQRSDNLVPLSF